jgi:hypothetical protein
MVRKRFCSHALPASLPFLPADGLASLRATRLPLTRLTRLRGLTLQAPECSWSEEEAAQALRGLTALRSLHLSIEPQGRAGEGGGGGCLSCHTSLLGQVLLCCEAEQ